MAYINDFCGEIFRENELDFSCATHLRNYIMSSETEDSNIL
jgi:hypothetical protein